MKLYDDTEPKILSTEKLIEKQHQIPDTFNKDVVELEHTVNAYESLTTVLETVSQEQFNFIDKKNHVLFNEYIKTITRNLDVKGIPLVSTEAIEVLPTVALNHHLALEGFISSMWEKVKTLFNKIYEGVKEFFKKHFTRVGVIKKKLINLKEVLAETDKDIKQLNLEKVPSSIASKFPYNGTVDEGVVSKALATSDIVLAVLEVTNKEAIKLADTDILSKDFVAKIKSLKEQIGSNKEKIDENDANKATGLAVLKKANREKNAELREENKSLSELNKENKANLKGEEGKLTDTVTTKANIDALFEGDGFAAAKKEMEAYVKKVQDAFNKLVNKPIPGGKTITEVKVTDSSGIEIEFDTNKDEPDSVSLGAKNGLSKMVSAALTNIETMEKVTENYTKINDTIIKNLDTVDKLIAEVDKMSSQAEYNDYKIILQGKVKERLKLMQTFFTNYNKINKNLIGVVADSCDGVIAYTVASLKHFG